MTDTRKLARQIGEKDIYALADAILLEAVNGDGPALNSPCARAIRLAAERLAAPEVVAPKWPAGVLCAGFDRQTGEIAGTTGFYPNSDGRYFTVPCRVVPADAVVLTRREVETIQRSLDYHVYHKFHGYGVAEECQAILRRAAGQGGTDA